MYSSNLLLSLCLLFPLLALAQKDKQAYCDMKKVPNLNGCLDIKDHGVKDSGWYNDNEWWSDNCRVNVYGTFGDNPSMTGGDLKQAIQNILDACGSGFEYIVGVRVEVNLCTLGQGGITVECSSPLQMVRGFPDKKKRDTLPSGRRHHLTDVQSANPNQVFSRQSEPFEGIICGGGPGSAKVQDCLDVSNELRDKKNVDLPYIGGTAACQVQIWPTSRDKKSTETSHSSYSMTEDLTLCADSTKTYVGFISNYHGYDYHFFFGQFCGAFGTGRGDGCFPA